MSQPTIGIVTVLPEEFASVRSMLDQSNSVAAGRPPQVYATGRMPAMSGEHSIVLIQLPDYGNNQSAAAATRMMEHFPTIDTLIFCGIAGGIPSPNKVEDHVRLGDVVVSGNGGIVQYDLQKVTEEDVEHRPRPRAPSAACLSAARRLEADELEGKANWLEHLSRGVHIKNSARPAEQTDLLYRGKGQIPHPPDPARNPGVPRVFIGTIASGNSVVKNESLRDRVATRFQARAIEMESAGLADAAWLTTANAFAVRGVCDYCDGRKNDVWHGYAALVAAGYLRALLEQMPPLPAIVGEQTVVPLGREPLLSRIRRCIEWHRSMLISPSIIVGLAGSAGLLVGCEVSEAQPSSKLPVIGCLLGIVVCGMLFVFFGKLDHIISKLLTGRERHGRLELASENGPEFSELLLEAADFVERCRLECPHG